MWHTELDVDEDPTVTIDYGPITPLASSEPESPDPVSIEPENEAPGWTKDIEIGDWGVILCEECQH